MIKITNLKQTEIDFDTVLTIGTFDGVHIGHQKIMSSLIKKSLEYNLKSAVLTFFPHPRMVLQKDANIKLINTLDERSHLLEKAGLDYLMVEKFSTEFSRLSAYDFVKDLLVNKLHAKHIIIGYDHRFGRNRMANIKDLIEFGNRFNFQVHEISVQDCDEVAVSSTKIRNALMEGDIQKANSYLGYYFMLSGVIVKGKGIGKTMGFPTANLYIEESYKLIPKNGVYVVASRYQGEKIYGMMNIGTNPTVNGIGQSIEINFFDFDKNLYNEKLQIDLYKRLRDEEKFDSVTALKIQIEKDRQNALKFLNRDVS